MQNILSRIRGGWVRVGIHGVQTELTILREKKRVLQIYIYIDEQHAFEENTAGIVEQTSRQAVNRVGPLLMAKARGFNLPLGVVPFLTPSFSF